MEMHGPKELRLLEIGRGSSVWQCVWGPALKEAMDLS